MIPDLIDQFRIKGKVEVVTGQNIVADGRVT